MLRACVAAGWSLQNYYQPEHPLQKFIKNKLEAVFNHPFSFSDVGTDGCGLPTFRLPLSALASGYQRLASRDLGKSGQLVYDAMIAHPELLSSQSTLSYSLMKHAALLIKDGAEGVGCMASQDGNCSVSFKIVGGNQAGVDPVLKFLCEKEFHESCPDFPIVTHNVAPISDLQLPLLEPFILNNS